MMSADGLRPAQLSAPAPSPMAARWPATVLAAALGGALLGLPYNFPDLYLLTWVAFVPLLWATSQASLRRAYGLGLCAGLVMYLIGASWMVDFMRLYKGFGAVASGFSAALFWLYCAQLPACLFLVYRWLALRTGWVQWCLFPPLVAIFYSCFPMLFPVQLAGSQSRFLVAIQGTDLFGAAGLDFVIALTNALLWAALRARLRRRARTGSWPAGGGQMLRWLPAALLVAGWLLYGLLAVQRWDTAVEDWPRRKVGMVQPDEVPSEALPPPVPGYSRAYPPEMALTEHLAGAGAEVIIWPETRYKGYFDYAHVRHSFVRYARDLGVPLIFQDIEKSAGAGRKVQYNTAVLLGADGEPNAVYRKTKRVPLGEYLPLLEYAPALEHWLYERLPQLFANFDAGAGPSVFAIDDLAMTPLICYEVMFPSLTAGAVAATGGRLLVVLSNNGWFGSSRQPYQHLYASVLRSVENRVPMLHVTNNGPSGLVLPNGRLVVETAYHQQMAALLSVPFAPEPPVTVFNRHPQLFLRTLLVVMAASVALAIWRGSSKRAPKVIDISQPHS